MSTPRAHARPALRPVAVLALVLPVLGTAGLAAPAAAVPVGDHHPTVSVPGPAGSVAVPAPGRPCFMTRHPWNVSLDGFAPVC